MHNLKKKVKNKTLILEMQVKTSRKLSIHTYLDSTSVLNSTPNRNMINFQMMGAQAALEGSRRKVFQAIALDPLTAAVCSLDEIQSMTDEMFEALASEINHEFSN